MVSGQHFFGKDDLRRQGGQGFPQHPVGAVAYAGLAQGAIEDHLKAVRLGIFLPEEPGSPLRPHGVGRRGAFADFVYFSYGLHGISSIDISSDSIAEILEKNNGKQAKSY